MVSPATIHQVRQLYINAEYTVFDLVPPSFNTYIEMCYHQLGCLPVGRSSAWAVYCDLLALMWQCEGVATVLTTIDGHDVVNNEELQLLPGLHDLHETDGYMGGLANGLGFRKCTAVIN